MEELESNSNSPRRYKYDLSSDNLRPEKARTKMVNSHRYKSFFLMPNELIQINILIFAISTIPIRNKIDDKSTKIVQNPVK